jgi:SAM-dependent methyltransferase
MPTAEPQHTVECKVCGYDAHYFDAADFSQTCLRTPFPEAGVAIPYFRCGNCNFLFTTAFDTWSQDDFLREIYNQDYEIIDPEFVSVRPLAAAFVLDAKIAPQKASVRLLDYGGGRGTFTRRMRELGYRAASYDPFFKGEMEPREGERFDLIHCREVIEHTPDPRGFAADLLHYLDDEGVVFISTVVQPQDILQQRLKWWYAAPRNGHISLFSHESLGMLWLEHGLQFGSFDEVRHIAWRGNPPCLRLLKDSDDAA